MVQEAAGRGRCGGGGAKTAGEAGLHALTGSRKVLTVLASSRQTI